MDAPCRTKTIRNNEKIKHEMIIHPTRLTISSKKNDWNMFVNIKSWMLKNREKLFSRKSCFLRRIKIIDSPVNFHEYCPAKISLKRINQQDIIDEDLLWSVVGNLSSSGKLNLQFVRGRWKAADYVKMLDDLSSHTKRVLSMWRRMDFSALHKASITKKYLLEQK